MEDKNKKRYGWATLIVVALIPVFLLIFFGDNLDFSNYSSATHNFGEIFGLVGMTLFALTFILSTRIKAIEDIFGGLDETKLKLKQSPPKSHGQCKLYPNLQK
jgi:predicted ferric reductase